MDLMIFAQLAIVLLFIFVGARFGSIGIGFAGAAGVLVLTLGFGLETSSKHIPISVILIIMSVIATVSAMQVAGGMDWLVDKAENFLRKNPKRITIYAPIVTYFMTLLAGTGHTAFSTLPVIAEVAKGQGIRPSRPLSIAVVASQVAITASPVSAAVVVFAGFLDPFDISYLQLLAICIPTTFVACMIGAFVAQFLGKELKDDPIYQDRLAKGLIKEPVKAEAREIPKTGLTSVIIFALAIVAVIIYAIMVKRIEHPPVQRNEAIMLFMMTAAALIVGICKIDAAKILNASTFKSGMSAAICVLGVAWLGNIFVQNHIVEIKQLAGNVLQQQPWLLAVVLFFASMLLYSQAATTRTLMPAALTLVSPAAAIASFAAVSALFVLPTYPTLIAAVEMDDTGSTRVGKYVFNHPFFIPGVVTIASSVLLGFALTGIIL